MRRKPGEVCNTTMTARPRPAADVVYLGLREQICLLDLPPGSVLREAAIADEFGVSRTPVREALTMLRVDGLVTRHHGEASTVSTVDFRELRNVYALRMKLTRLVGDFGLTSSELQDGHVMKLFEIVKLAIGGYVIGRSGEKVVKTWKGNGS